MVHNGGGEGGLFATGGGGAGGLTIGGGEGRLTTGGADGGRFARVGGDEDRRPDGGGEGDVIDCGDGRIALCDEGKFFVTGWGPDGRTVGPAGTTPGAVSTAAGGMPDCGCLPGGAVLGATVAGGTTCIRKRQKVVGYRGWKRARFAPAGAGGD